MTEEEYLKNRLDFIRRNSVYGLCVDKDKLKEVTKELFKTECFKPKKIHGKCKYCGAYMIFYGKNDRVKCLHCAMMNEGCNYEQ